MPQDVEFFGRYGFNIPMIIVFGIVQITGGALMAIPVTRVTGVVIVSLTFILSLVLLISDRNGPFSIATIIALIALFALFAKGRRARRT